MKGQMQIFPHYEKSYLQKSNGENSTEDKINFFIPLDITKSKTDPLAMKVKGIASTRDVDSDQEILEPEGFVLDKFMKSGFLNYNHKSGTDPEAIVGEPTKAVVNNGALQIEGFLYGDSKKAKKLWKTINTVHKNSKTRRFGLSIEGRALARDPFNEKRITKALITGCAITPTPKNAHTLLEVMKGEVDYEEPIYEMEKSENGGEIEYIIDIIDEKGCRTTVDKNMNIKIHKMTVEDMRPALPESVAGTKKKKVISNLNDDLLEKNNKKFSKSEAYNKIFTIFTSDIVKAKNIYALMQKIESLNDGNMKTEISQETIEKAQEILNIVGEEAKGKENLKKSDDNDEDDEGKEKNEELEKMKKSLDEFKGKVADMEQKIAAAQGSTKDVDDGTKPDENGGSVTKKGEDGKSLESDEEGKKIEKSEDAKSEEEIKKAEVKDIFTKAEANDLFKSFQDTLNEKFKAIGELYVTAKASDEELREELDEVKKSFDTINDKLDAIANSPATGRKGIITKSFVDRFQKENPDAKVMSLSQNKQDIVDTLFELSNISKGENIDFEYETEYRNLESSGGFGSQRVIDRLKKEQNIIVVE